jgi:hypothetical protein
MAAKSQTLNNNILAAVLQNAGYTGTATLYVALNTSTSTPTAPGTEVTGDSNYARQPITSASGWSPTPPTASTCANAALLSFFGAGAVASHSLVEIAIYSAATGGTELYYGGISGAPKTINIGDTASIAIGALTVTES